MTKIHKTLTADVIIEAVERRMTTLDNSGFCIACGAEAEDCEPDACNYECEECGKKQVFGADEILLML